MNTIKFSKEFIKLQGQTKAELLAVKMVCLADLSDEAFKDLIEYDCKAVDDSYYPLNRNKSYCLLVFLGNKNIVFQTLRNKDKYIKYNGLIGHIFDVVVENEK